MPKDVRNLIFTFANLTKLERENFERIFHSLKDFNQKQLEQMSPIELKRLYTAEYDAMQNLNAQKEQMLVDLDSLNAKVSDAVDAHKGIFLRLFTSVFTGPNADELALVAARKAFADKDRELQSLRSVMVETESAMAQVRKRYASESDVAANKHALDEVAKLFGGPEKFSQLPALDLRSLKLEATTLSRDYIDYIQPEHVTSPIMRGEDILGRRFVVLRLQQKGISRFLRQPVCITIFERYPMGTMWQTAGNNSHILGEIMYHGAQHSQGYTKLQNVLQGRDPTWEIK